jgi:putative glycosyltransferase (TIGR04348 family)
MSQAPDLPTVGIVTPALADANNGNWQTARRWARMLADTCRVELMSHWAPEQNKHLDVMLALHARRSAPSVAAWATHHPERPLIVALTGTDLYRDIQTDATAQHSLAVAHRLVVLQDAGLEALPEALRAKSQVIYQSSTTRQPRVKTRRHLRVVVVGHLRVEKSPHTVWAAARMLTPGEGILIDHLGHALDPALGETAKLTMQESPHYRWLGGLTHGQAREHIQRAHLLLHPSQMEGGAHVVMEAITSGTPVLASRVSGNIGMLGQDYEGYFEWNDAVAVVRALRRYRHELATDGAAHSLHRLHAQCQARAPLFSPEREAALLQQCVHELMNP